MHRHRRHAGPLLLSLAAALASWPAAARAQLSLQLNPGMNLTSTTTTDETGHQVRTDGASYTQKYRLSLDEQLYPLLKVSTAGSFDWNIGRATADGVASTADDKRWTLFSGLRLGSPILNGGLDLDYRGETSRSASQGISSTSPTITRLGLAGYAGWKPADLPTLDLRLSRSDTYDQARVAIDTTSQDATLSSRYQPDPTVQLQYGLRGSDTTDHLTGVTATDVSNSISASWTDRFAGGRGNAYLGYSLSVRAGNITVTGRDAGAQVLTRQLPVAGLSIVDGLTTTPDRVTLNPNPALLDGDTVASAGLNLGTSASVGGQGQPRELGMQFANLITPVNTVYLWIKDVPIAPVAGLFTFAIWQSDDNVTWTAVANPLPGGSVHFSQIPGQPYFRLDLPATIQARYLKVVTRPLPVGSTTDPQLADIPVTELQVFNAVAADQVRGRSFTVGGNLTGSARYQLLDDPGLTYDTSFILGHANRAGSLTWSLVNGLSILKRLSRVFGANARVDRSDGDSGRGHESADRWGATLSAEPLPTLGGGLTYGGLLSQSVAGTALSHSLSAFARAALYQGIDTSANGSVTTGTTVKGQTQRSSAVAGSLGLTPNSRFSLSGSASATTTETSGGGLAAGHDRSSIVSLAATFVPVPALSMAGGVSRYFVAGRPATTANFSATATPFQGGQLQLSYGYQEILDLANDARTRTQGPSLRWNMRPGWSLDAAYSLLETTTPAQRIETQGLFANLLINLH